MGDIPASYVSLPDGMEIDFLCVGNEHYLLMVPIKGYHYVFGQRSVHISINTSSGG